MYDTKTTTIRHLHHTQTYIKTGTLFSGVQFSVTGFTHAFRFLVSRHIGSPGSAVVAEDVAKVLCV